MIATGVQASPSGRFTAKKGDRFGSYVLVRQLGHGGMASVYEAEHCELGKRVALKIMHPTVASETVATTRFLREARAAAQLRHLHIVNVFDVGTEDGLPYLVMELLEGGHLGAALAEGGPFPLPALVELFLPVISAVHAAHRHGVIHRDLKPANIFLSDRGCGRAHPVVVDFGISKTASGDDATPLTQSESLLGTVPYMSPEQTKGAKFADVKSDQYAIAVMLYECATGRRPFQGNSHYDLMHAIVTAGVQPPSRVNAALPAEFDHLVLRAMNREADKRFPTMHALGSALISFGSKTTSTLWEGEFLDIKKRVACSESDPDTLHDNARSDATSTSPTGSSARLSGFRKRWPRVVLVALALYAAFATWLLIDRGYAGDVSELSAFRASAPREHDVIAFERAMTEAEPGSSGAQADPIAETTFSLPSEEPRQPGQDPAVPTRKREGPALPASSRASPASRSETRRTQSDAVSEASRPEKTGEPKLVLGTNSAPIVE